MQCVQRRVHSHAAAKEAPHPAAAGDADQASRVGVIHHHAACAHHACTVVPRLPAVIMAITCVTCGLAPTLSNFGGISGEYRGASSHACKAVRAHSYNSNASALRTACRTRSLSKALPAAAARHKGGTIEEAGVGEGEGDGEGNVLAAVSLPSVSPVARSSLVQTCR